VNQSALELLCSPPLKGFVLLIACVSRHVNFAGISTYASSNVKPYLECADVQSLTYIIYIHVYTCPSLPQSLTYIYIYIYTHVHTCPSLPHVTAVQLPLPVLPLPLIAHGGHR